MLSRRMRDGNARLPRTLEAYARDVCAVIICLAGLIDDPVFCHVHEKVIKE